MAKDPAINWYFDNWDGGTKLFTRHQKGCYMDLLSAQFHSGPLSLENIKTVLGSDFQASWPVISKKFAEKNGFFFNERLEAERQKRIAYSESRSKNRQKKDMINISKTHEKDMKIIPETGTETGTDFKEGGVGEELIRGEVFFNVEDLVKKNQAWFEQTLMKTGVEKNAGAEELRKYHLYLGEKEQYPKPKKALLAGFEKWLINSKNFNNGRTTINRTGNSASSPGKSAGAKQLVSILRDELTSNTEAGP